MREREKDFHQDSKEGQGGCLLSSRVFQREETGKRGNRNGHFFVLFLFLTV